MSDIISIVKRRTVSALVSDEVFMGILVLKGGNALNLAYNISTRGSIDIDFSIEGDFSEDEKNRMQNQAEYLLNAEFEKENMKVFDVKFYERPTKIAESVKEFWGGYKLDFKLIEIDKYKSYYDDIDKQRREALSVGKKGSTVFTVDISKYEYVAKRKTKDLDGAIVQVYSPEMICLEKLRAICQQTNEYKDIIKSMSIRPRARDFYDIINLTESFMLNFKSEDNVKLAELIFKAKRVPLNFIALISNYYEFHLNDWESVIQTIEQNTEIKSFDYYYERVRNEFNHLIS